MSTPLEPGRAGYRHATSRGLSIITVGAAKVMAAGALFAVGGTVVESGSAGAPSEYEDGQIAACRLDPARRTGRTVFVYLQKKSSDRRRRVPRDPRNYVPVARTITEVEARAPLRAALLNLMRGATKRERRLGCFSMFSRDANVLRGVNIVDGQAVVDFHRRPFRDQLAIVSASHAGAVFMTQLELTIFRFPNVNSIRCEFNGDCTAFGNFMQAGRCVVVRRSDRIRPSA